MTLDIETTTDPIAVSLASASSGAHFERVALHRIRAAAILIGEVDADTVRFSIRSWSDAETPEDTMIGEIAAALAGAGSTGGLLLTYYGRAHDLTVLRRRAARYLMFDVPGLTRWDEGGWPHLDMLDLPPRNAKRVSLIDGAAGIGIAVPQTPKAGSADAPMRKAQIDVVLTQLLYLHEQALFRGEGSSLLNAWHAIGELIETNPALSHLRGLAKPAAVASW